MHFFSEQMISPVPDIRTLEIDPKTDSFIVLACDGIWNSLTSQEVVDFVGERLGGTCDGDVSAQDPTTQEIQTICEEVSVKFSLLERIIGAVKLPRTDLDAVVFPNLF